MVQVFTVGSSEPQVVSAWWKETAQTRVFFQPRALLLNHLEPQSSKTKLLLHIMLIGIVTCATTTTTLFILAFTLLGNNVCRNSCILIEVLHGVQNLCGFLCSDCLFIR